MPSCPTHLRPSSCICHTQTGTLTSLTSARPTNSPPPEDVLVDPFFLDALQQQPSTPTYTKLLAYATQTHTPYQHPPPHLRRYSGGPLLPECLPAAALDTHLLGSNTSFILHTPHRTHLTNTLNPPPLPLPLPNSPPPTQTFWWTPFSWMPSSSSLQRPPTPTFCLYHTKHVHLTNALPPPPHIPPHTQTFWWTPSSLMPSNSSPQHQPTPSCWPACHVHLWAQPLSSSSWWHC